MRLDMIHPQPFERGLQMAADLLIGGIARALRKDHNFGGDADLMADRAQRFANQHLIVARGIAFGSVGMGAPRSWAKRRDLCVGI
jgi:hypothetical protein